mmetsp:Transcript_13935/g.29751  ORF Transcript_13935/g.29751 Transcript_13935/m.29751 type:complete len:205 (-) Transcript_13935:114-728(-)
MIPPSSHRRKNSVTFWTEASFLPAPFCPCPCLCIFEFDCLCLLLWVVGAFRLFCFRCLCLCLFLILLLVFRLISFYFFCLRLVLFFTVRDLMLFCSATWPRWHQLIVRILLGLRFFVGLSLGLICLCLEGRPPSPCWWRPYCFGFRAYRAVFFAVSLGVPFAIVIGIGIFVARRIAVIGESLLNLLQRTVPASLLYPCHPFLLL